jgi:Arc/MetJ-type ribon-helix-helix transcriptional regulator
MVGVSTQIAVRLPDEIVEFLDHAVATGRAPSRASVVASALEREMRRQLAERDAVILDREGAADDLDDVVTWAASHLSAAD